MMRCLVLALWVSMFPLAAKANASLAASIGSGWEVSPGSGRIPTNVMVAPGFDLFGDFVRLEAGLLAEIPDTRDSDFDLQFRPMLVVGLPLALYGRVVAGVSQLLHGPVRMAIGAALGIDGRISNSTKLFAEAGYVPRATGGDFTSIFEGRLGLKFNFVH